MIRFDREFFDAALIAGSVATILASISVILVLDQPYKYTAQPPKIVQSIGVALVSGLVASLLTDEWEAAVLSSASLLFGALICAFFFPYLNAQACMHSGGTMALTPMMLLWTYLWFVEMGMPEWFMSFFYVGTSFGVLCLPFLFVLNLPNGSMYTHSQWSRPTEPLPERNNGSMVSFHFCCYNEPPDMVIESLESLTKINYKNYEVIVCDNNTKDTDVWMPVRDYCTTKNTELGKELFKFFHVEGMEGAKAGALNYCLTKTHPEVMFIALIDADYQVKPCFPSSLVGFFDDDEIGYVQTPHFYRDREETLFKNISYWMYITGYRVVFPSFSEYAMPITVGTMCVYRRKALELAGPWAEWCLTEDSEMSIRIHHVGFKGIFLNTVMGNGLIPESFADLRKQWFRWTAGPIKTFFHHFRMYILAWTSPRSTKMTFYQRVLLLEQSIKPILMPLSIFLSAFFGVASFLLVYYGYLPRVVLPSAAWHALLIALPATILDSWPHYKLCNDGSSYTLVALMRGKIGAAALVGVKIEAAFVAVFCRKALPWVRTPKFEQHEPQYWWALTRGAPLESALCLVFAGGAVGFCFLIQIVGDVAGFFVFLFAMLSVTFFCSVSMVLLGEMAKTTKKNKKLKMAKSKKINGSRHDQADCTKDEELGLGNNRTASNTNLSGRTEESAMDD